jgi:hypothetical protein
VNPLHEEKLNGLTKTMRKVTCHHNLSSRWLSSLAPGKQNRARQISNNGTPTETAIICDGGFKKHGRFITPVIDDVRDSKWLILA